MPGRGGTRDGSLLDCERIESLRLERGLSQRELGRRTGATLTVIKGLEAGRNHNELSLRFLTDLATALEVEPAALFQRAAEPEESGKVASEADVRKLGAAFAGERTGLSRKNLARTLGWKLDRLDRALGSLGERLAEVGMSVERGSSGWKLRPDLAALAWDDELRLAQARHRERGLLLREAELLRAALDNPLDRSWEQHLGNADRVALGGLLKSGLLVRSDAGLVASDSVTHSLPRIAAATSTRRRPRGSRSAGSRTDAARRTQTNQPVRRTQTRPKRAARRVGRASPSTSSGLPPEVRAASSSHSARTGRTATDA